MVSIRGGGVKPTSRATKDGNHGTGDFNCKRAGSDPSRDYGCNWHLAMSPPVHASWQRSLRQRVDA